MPASSSAYMRGAANTQAIYIPLQPEQLFQEEANVHRRSWAENVTYLTGCGYLMGAGMGGAVSLAAKLRAEGPPPPEVRNDDVCLVDTTVYTINEPYIPYVLHFPALL